MKDREEILKILHLIAKPRRFRLAKMLRDAGKPMSHSEIKKLLELKGKGLGKYTDGSLWRDLKLLANSGILKYERRMKVNPETGMTKVSSFSITKMGRETILKIEEILKSGLENSPFLLLKFTRLFCLNLLIDIFTKLLVQPFPI